MKAPTPYKMQRTRKRLAVFDLETDPFKHGRPVAPFAAGFYDGEIYRDFWGDDCVAQLFDWLKANYAPDELLLYAHNGGRFDFYLCAEHFDANQYPDIINGRLTRVRIGGFECRDSFAILPVPLAAHDKGTIDYERFERDVRERYRLEILAYLKRDCLSLHEMVSRFHDEFGDKLTIGGASLASLRSFHGVKMVCSQRTDVFLRQFYFGGRVQAFERGRLPGRWQALDVTSMYPHVMATMLHPAGADYFMRRDLHRNATFAKITARNYGALPVRDGQGGLSFDCEHGEFLATMHEIEAGLETGTLEIERVHYAVQFNERTTFAEFVETFFAKRQASKRLGDDLSVLLLKLILNSAYGKFGQNPDDYMDNAMTLSGVPDDGRGLWGPDNQMGWRFAASRGDRLTFWEAKPPNPARAYKNVAIAASITGAARAQMLRGLAQAKRPIYCDTDSLICESFAGLIGSELGQWKLEASGDCAHIGGKKIYALTDAGEPVKYASKGARLTADDVARIAAGEAVKWTSPVPNFKRDSAEGKAFGRQEFVSREIRATGTRQRYGKRHVSKVGA